MGRPPIEITPELCEKAESLAAQGLTMEQIALVLGMGETTLYKKKLEFAEFTEAIKAGQAKGVAAVVNKLYKKAVGYSISEERLEINEAGETKTIKTTKSYQPDNTAIIFYLKNRAAWKDKTEVEHSGEMKVTKIERVIVKHDSNPAN